MTIHLPSRTGFEPYADDDIDLDHIPGIPRGSRLLAPLGALLGGAASGVVVGVCAGPIGLRVGAGVGATVALIACLSMRTRRPRPVDRFRSHEATPRARPHRFWQLLLRLVGWGILVLGVVAGLMTYLVMNDDRLNAVNPVSPLWPCVVCLAFLAIGSAILLPSRPPEREIPRVRIMRTNRRSS
jgi:hypothetical protein